MDRLTKNVDADRMFNVICYMFILYLLLCCYMYYLFYVININICILQVMVILISMSLWVF